MNFLNGTSTLPSGLSIWTKVDTNQCRMCWTFELPSIPKTSVTRNWPSERVPVLSSATTFSLPKMSRKLPPFTKSPNLAACAIPQVVTTGVEITNAQGHATTRSTNARYSQCLCCCTCSAHGTTAMIAAATTIPVVTTVSR